MRVTINGEPRDVPTGTTATAVVNDLAEGRRRVAVAVNGEVLPREQWDTAVLSDGDRIEIVAAIQGG